MQVVQYTPGSPSESQSTLADAKKPSVGDTTGVIYLECGSPGRSSDLNSLAIDTPSRETSSPSPVKSEAALDQSSTCCTSASDLSVCQIPSGSFCCPLLSNETPDDEATSDPLMSSTTEVNVEAAPPTRSDSPDSAALLSEALFRLCTRASEEAAAKAAAAQLTPCADNTSTADVSITLTSSSITVQRFVVDLVIDDLVSCIVEDEQAHYSYATQQSGPTADIISSRPCANPALTAPSDSHAPDNHSVPFTVPTVDSQMQQDAAVLGVHDAVLGHLSPAAGVTDLEQCGLADYVMDELLEQVVAVTAFGAEPVEWEVPTPVPSARTTVVMADTHTEEHASSSLAFEVNSPQCSTCGEVTGAERFIGSPESAHTSSSLSLADLPSVALDLSCAATPAHASTSDLVDHHLLDPSSTSAADTVAEADASNRCQVTQAADEPRAAEQNKDGGEEDKWWMDNGAFEDLLKAVPTELAQVCIRSFVHVMTNAMQWCLSPRYVMLMEYPFATWGCWVLITSVCRGRMPIPTWSNHVHAMSCLHLTYPTLLTFFYFPACFVLTTCSQASNW